jgi:hypothetical protein
MFQTFQATVEDFHDPKQECALFTEAVAPDQTTTP